MVTRRRKLIAASGVLAAGFALACLAGPPGSAVGMVSSYPPAGGPQLVDPEFVFPPTASADRALEDSGDAQPRVVNYPPNDSPADDVRLSQPPSLTSQRFSTGVQPSVGRPSTQRSAPPELPPRFQSHLQITGERPAPSSNPPLARPAKPELVDHVVHNGDTLERIARRYLGDESRAIEIFNLNRGVLKNPQILPIGAELRIPVEHAEQ